MDRLLLQMPTRSRDPLSSPPLVREPLPDRPALVVAAPWPYHPACGIGGGVLCFSLLERLARLFEVHFVSFDQVPHDPEGGRRALARICASVTLVPLPVPVRGLGDRWFQLAQVARRAPREVRDMQCPGMAEAIARLVAAHAPEAVLLQFPQMAQYATAAGAAPVVMDVQDVAAVSRWRECRATRGTLKRAARAVAWAAWARYELHHYARCDALLALSDNDLGVLRSFLPEVPAALSPVAIELRPEAPPATAPHVAFIGNFDHAPNRDALAWLRGTIWPLVRARRRDAVLHVAGPGAPAPSASDAEEGVVVHGFVESLDAFYGAAQVAVVPYRFGGGTKIKALDAMARGCPLVATTVGAEGLRAVPGEHLRVADDAEGFAREILDLLGSEVARQRQAEAAREHLARHFSWEAKMAGLAAVLREVRSRRAVAA